jgi:deazaflavin-dependent oxidoreductase (nitroreductase family)
MKSQSNHRYYQIETALVVGFYRLIGGLVGERYKILVLTTKGCKSGRERHVSLMYMPYLDGYLLTAANIGSDEPPAWLLNLQSNPQASIQIGWKKIKVIARVAEAEEREILWKVWTDANPAYLKQQANTERAFPMVLLSPQ